MKEEMISVDVVWEKDGTKVPMKVLRCACGGHLRNAGYVPCIHDDGGADVWQCVECKKIFIGKFYQKIDEDLAQYGWTLIEDGSPSPEKEIISK